MDDTPLEEARFTDQEVREILQRAVARRPAEGVASGSSGYSLAELRAIAGEVGIDAASLDAAARSVALERRGRTSRLLGAPRVITVERTADGAFDPTDTPKMLATIRRRMGEKGEVQEIHGSLEWSVSNDILERHVAMSPAADGTTISASTNLTNTMILAYFPVAVIGSVTLVVSLAEIGLFLIPVLLVVLRFIMAGIAGREAEKLEAVVDDLARFVAPHDDAPAQTDGS